MSGRKLGVAPLLYAELGFAEEGGIIDECFLASDASAIIEYTNKVSWSRGCNPAALSSPTLSSLCAQGVRSMGWRGGGA